MSNKLDPVIAIPQSGVYKPPLTVKLECPDVRVEPTTVSTTLSLKYLCYSLNIVKVSNTLYFNSQLSNSSTGSLGMYNIASNTISAVSTPYNTFSASFVNINNNIYIIGGFDPKTGALNNSIMKYEIGSSTVSTVSAKLSQNLRNTPCVAIGKYIYIIGGYNGTETVKLIQRYDTELDTIETMSSYSLIYGPPYMGVAEYNGKIYVIGGTDGGTGAVQVIDTVIGTVNTTTSPPVSDIGGAGASIIGDYLYIFGGQVNGTPSNKIFKKYLLDDSDWVEESYTLAYNRSLFGYTTDEKGYYHIIGGHPVSYGHYYETGRFGLPLTDVEIRYTQTDDDTTPSDPTETDTLYNAPIELSSATKHKIKAKAFYVGL